MDERTKLFNEYEKLLHKWAHSYRRTTGIEEEELFSEACVAYMSAIMTYREDKKVKLSTWISRCVQNRLNDFISQLHHKQEVTLFDEDKMELFEAPDEFFKVFALTDIYSSLSPKATFICELVIEKQETLTEVPPKKARGIISRELRQLGWFWSDIWQSFAELKEVL